jgi:alpha-L-fucosidase
MKTKSMSKEATINSKALPISKKTESNDLKTEWFINDRFGMFIHWGLYALPARHEWVRHHEKITVEDYQKYFDHFNPDLFDPKKWAKAAKEAGMKYFVITAKHHEGFALWDTKMTEYKATNTKFGKDLINEVINAFREEGLKIGLYYSLIDWFHSEFTLDGLHPQRDDLKFRESEKNRDQKIYIKYMHNQIRELLTNYGKIDTLWMDYSYSHMEWDWSKGKGKKDWDSQNLVNLVRELQPEIIINDRLEVGGDIKTPEQLMPRKWVEVNGKKVLWESCQTMNGSWGYHRDNLDWKPSELLIKMLVDSVSKGGNMLLNIGPNARGEFDNRSITRLKEMGEWMRLHNRSIYGCTASEYNPPRDCRYTQNGKKLYLHIFSWPFKNIFLEGMGDMVEYAQLLNDASEIKYFTKDPNPNALNCKIEGDKGDLILEIPVQKPDVAVPVIELFLK